MLATVTGLLAAVLQCAFLLQGLSGSRLSVVHSLVSELEARDQPDSGFFRLASLLAGVAAVLFAAALRRRLPAGWAGSAGCRAIALFGLGSIADAAMPLDCAPSAEPVCRSLEEHGPLSWPHQAHTWSSVLGICAVIASLWLFGRHLHGRPQWRATAAAGRIGFGWLAGYSATVGVMALRYTAGVGLAQRVQILAFAAWLVLLSLPPLRSQAPAADRSPSRTSSPR